MGRWRGPRNTASTAARGYNAAHVKARKAAAARHQPTDPCVRCGRPLGPMGRWLHLDHDDTRTGYLGFSHGSCNRRAGARKGQRKQATKAKINRPTEYTRW